MSVGDKIPSLGQWCNQNDTYEIPKPRQTSPNHCEDTKTNEGRCDFFQKRGTLQTTQVYLHNSICVPVHSGLVITVAKSSR